MNKIFFSQQATKHISPTHIYKSKRTYNDVGHIIVGKKPQNINNIDVQVLSYRDHLMMEDKPTVTFTASPTEQWGGTFATVLNPKKGNNIFKIKHGKIKITTWQ